MRSPEINPLIAGLAHLILRLAGWHIEGQIPNLPKFVVVGAPHTSNWDGVLAMLVPLALHIRLHWIGKHTLFRFPFGPLMRVLGGIPVDRHTSRGAVEQMVDMFNSRERMVLGVTPEGTRRKVKRWRTGFYRIAQGADVPLVLFYYDYPRRTVGFGPTFTPSGDIDADVAQMQAFYADKVGKHPERMI